MSLTNDKRTLYVGGLEESVTLDVLRAAFVPFGELVDVNLPTDPSGQKHRGFAFVQFGSVQDAQRAARAMDGTSLRGRRVNVRVNGDGGGGGARGRGAGASRGRGRGARGR